jgi:hypothetical protein
MCKKSLIACAITLAAFGAQAQERNVRALLGLGATFGGDTLATVRFTDNTTEDVRGGGLVHLYGGVEFRVAPQVTLQTTVGYHVSETSSAGNGTLRFSRYPIELLGHFQIDPRVRLGGGARFVNSAKIDGSGVLGGNRLEFESTTGAVVEGEYLVLPNFGIKMRFVGEQYRPKGGGPSADGNHVGFYVNWYL